jgi:hypothetical protein
MFPDAAAQPMCKLERALLLFDFVESHNILMRHWSCPWHRCLSITWTRAAAPTTCGACALMDRFEVETTGTCNAAAQIDNAACAHAYLDNLLALVVPMHDDESSCLITATQN